MSPSEHPPIPQTASRLRGMATTAPWVERQARHSIVTTRLTDEERALLDHNVAATGLSRSDLLREAQSQRTSAEGETARTFVIP